MDYKQKYEEIVEWARKYKARLNGVPIEEVLPELAESEDERIRKQLIDAIKIGRSNSGVSFTEEAANRYIAWLEKYSEEGIKKIRKEEYTNGFNDAAGFGKQKENPKSVDSISSDCMSDVKCEDRWHKVADSLPDNPREVLCKDEAGNYFIGRYYSGEGWEISNYDDEDKPHHLNPPVSKWIDFPSEKQKEQNLIMANSPQLKEQKQEWSEHQHKLLNYAISMTDDREVKKFLELLRNQPVGTDCPQEWSEEDEDTINLMIAILRENHPNGQFKTNPVNTTCMSVISTDMLIKRIESLKPQSHWKPSEEQLKHLLILADYFESEGAVSNAKTLRELYEDLKKL